MTAEPELLPLPSVLLNWPHPTNHAAIRDYARANVAHATAAKDAEIEALRAEVALLRVGAENERLHQRGLLDREREHTERLAEALRPHIEDLERSAVVLDQYPAMAPTAAEMRKAAAELRAALDPTAAQENDDA